MALIRCVPEGTRESQLVAESSASSVLEVVTVPRMTLSSTHVVCNGSSPKSRTRTFQLGTSLPYNERGAWPGLGDLPLKFKAQQTTPLLRGTKSELPTYWASFPVSALELVPLSVPGKQPTYDPTLLPNPSVGRDFRESSSAS